MTGNARRQLDEQGYVLLVNVMGDRLLGELRTRTLQLLEEEGDRAGHEFKTEQHARRLANLVDKGDVFAVRSCCRRSSRACGTCLVLPSS